MTDACYTPNLSDRAHLHPHFNQPLLTCSSSYVSCSPELNFSHPVAEWLVTPAGMSLGLSCAQSFFPGLAWLWLCRSHFPTVPSVSLQTTTILLLPPPVSACASEWALLVVQHDRRDAFWTSLTLSSFSEDPDGCWNHLDLEDERVYSPGRVECCGGCSVLLFTSPWSHV